MEEKQARRRGWIKNIAIIFLALMLLLTFFSNTIMNYSLPEVSAQYAWGGNVTSKVRVNGTVEANETYDIVIDETRRIKGVYVRNGDTVAAGDTLFTLEDTEGTELTSARIDLENAEAAYKKALNDAGYDYTDLEASVDEAKKQLDKAQEVYNSLSDAHADYQAAKDKNREAGRALEALQNSLNEINAGIDAIKSGLGDSSVSVQQLLNAAKIQLSNARDALNRLNLELSNAEASVLDLKNRSSDENLIISTESGTIADLTSQINALGGSEAEITENIKSQESTVNQLKGEYDLAAENLKFAEENPALTPAAVAAARQDKEKKERDWKDACDELDRLKGLLVNTDRITALTDEMAVHQKNLDEASNRKAKYDNETGIKEKQIEKYYKDIEDAEAAVEAAEKLVEEREKNLPLDELTRERDALLIKIDEAEDKKERTQAAEDAAKANAISDDEAQTALDAAQRTYDSAVAALTRQQKQDQLDSADKNIDLELQRKELQRKRDEVARLEAKATGAVVTARMGGIVTSVNAVAGEDVSAGSTVATIQVADKGYVVKLNLTTEQCAYLTNGEPVKVTNYWYGNITASIASIKNDPQNPGRGKIVTVSVTSDSEGDVLAGQSLSLVLGERGQYYDAVVPTSAIREDNNGKFVLVVVSKSSPLGARYFANRMDITTNVSDETNTAVNGLTGSEFVITTSTKPITAGQQVRLIENQ